ncbi:uncharacterized F-box/LRR-repeat protein C02F5.7-like [Anoplophora glabripennis]|uniref:uncharacterized F-box/LRR-repeat protein C02F5.7-like n=1 Tax=Anoplophora glabripennis TaxID=217634 RepID=UPI000875586D|nr:uncharacterized F-box/LRR-repeat protein C02F5.7-like [Anoplophora glabripennis]
MFAQTRNSYILRNQSKAHMPYSEAFIPAKRLRNCDYSASLPNEILLYIFSFLSHKELYKIARCVCKRWYMLTSSPVLWKKITAQNEVPSNILCKWIENSPLLKEVNLRERSDINTVTEKLSKYCKNLQSLKIENCRGTKNSSLVKSQNLCRLLTRCKYLNNLYFSGIKIQSCKFFKLLSKRKHFGITKKCSYYGPVSQKQMRALIESIVSSNTYDAATLFTSHRKISINELFNIGNNNAVNVPVTVDHIWEDIVNNNMEEDDDDYDAQMDIF